MKTSTQKKEFNKPIPGTKPFSSPAPAQKDLKVSTPIPAKVPFSFRMPASQPFQALKRVHSVKDYDVMISKLIGEVSRG